MSEPIVISGVDLSQVLDGFEKVNPSGSGQWILPGKYLMQVQQVELKKGYKGASIIGTNKVVHIFHTEDADLKVGEDRNFVENLTGANPGVAAANLKAYLLAGCESLYRTKIDPRKVSPAFVAPILGATQPLAGVFIICEAFTKPKAAAKNKAPHELLPTDMITVKNWHSVNQATLDGVFGVNAVQQPAPK